MAFKLNRPILIGGLGALTASGWALHGLHPAGALELGNAALWGAIAIGSGVWWFNRQSALPTLPTRSTGPISRATLDALLQATQENIAQLETEVQLAASVAVSSLHPSVARERLAQLTSEMGRTQASLAMAGGRGVGKTSLATALSQTLSGKPSTPVESALGSATTDESLFSSSQTEFGDVKDTTDLVLFVTTGDLVDSEYQSLMQLIDQRHRVILVFNKQDHYLPADRPLILQQLRRRVDGFVTPEDVVAIATQPAPRKIRQHQPDGSVTEKIEQPEPDISALTERLQHLLQTQGQQLIFNTVQRQALTLKQEIVSSLNQLRRDRALPLIEQSQWIAAAAAFANPLPSLDLLATAAINTQLIMDVGAIYQQSFSLDYAKTIVANMASLMVKLGLVEMTSQAVSSLLKSNTVTYVAGGLMQGISAAYLTRLAALSLVTYFEEQSQQVGATTDAPLQLDRLAEKLKTVFQDNQRAAFLKSLLQQGMQKLTPEQSPSALPSA